MIKTAGQEEEEAREANIAKARREAVEKARREEEEKKARKASIAKTEKEAIEKARAEAAAKVKLGAETERATAGARASSPMPEVNAVLCFGFGRMKSQPAIGRAVFLV